MKIRTSKKLKFQIFSDSSLVMLFQFVLAIKLSIFFHEQPLNVNAVVQTSTSSNYHGSIVRR